VFRLVVQFERAPDPERYRQHLDDFVSKVSCKAFRQGPAIGSPFGEPVFKHYAEFEWADKEAFESATRSAEFNETGRDAMEMGIPFTATFVELTE
jgi:hypothetical protein